MKVFKCDACGTIIPNGQAPMIIRMRVRLFEEMYAEVTVELCGFCHGRLTALQEAGAE